MYGEEGNMYAVHESRQAAVVGQLNTHILHFVIIL
jgi:hypothetical protein